MPKSNLHKQYTIEPRACEFIYGLRCFHHNVTKITTLFHYVVESDTQYFSDETLRKPFFKIPTFKGYVVMMRIRKSLRLRNLLLKRFKVGRQHLGTVSQSLQGMNWELGKTATRRYEW